MSVNAPQLAKQCDWVIDIRVRVLDARHLYVLMECVTGGYMLDDVIGNDGHEERMERRIRCTPRRMRRDERHCTYHNTVGC